MSIFQSNIRLDSCEIDFTFYFCTDGIHFKKAPASAGAFLFSSYFASCCAVIVTVSSATATSNPTSTLNRSAGA